MSGFCDGSGVIDDLDSDGTCKFWACRGCVHCRRK